MSANKGLMVAVQEYEGDIEEWDSFVEASRNGTIFGLRKFLSYHPPGRFDDCSLLFRDQAGRLLAVIPAAKYSECLISHPGASYGGPILARGTTSEQIFAMVKAACEYTKTAGFSYLELHPPPSIYSEWPCEELDYALWRHGFSISKMPLSSLVDLSDPVSMRSDTKRSIKKAEKSELVFRESAAWHTYWGILEDTLESRYMAEPTHSLGEMLELRRLFPDRIRLYGAFLGTAMAAGMVTFACNPRVLMAFYYATNYGFQNMRPLNLVISRVMEWARGAGFRWLDHGVSTENDGWVANWGLFRFKEGFGSTGVVRKCWRKTF